MIKIAKTRCYTKTALVIAWASLMVAHMSHSALQGGALTKARRESESSSECMHRFRAILHDEVRNPTKRRDTGEGYIDHDYQMAQIATAFRNLVRPRTPEGPATPGPEELAALNAFLDEEKLPEARDVFLIVLGWCGDEGTADKLVQIAATSPGPFLRRSAIASIRQVGDLATIPDLIQCLSDDGQSSPRMDPTSGKLKTSFPVRRAAAFVLRKFGVPVEELENCIYRPDRRAAVSVLDQELKTATQERSLKLIEAVSRVGGEDARKCLTDFVESNQSNAAKKELVSEAKRLLSELADAALAPGATNTPEQELK